MGLDEFFLLIRRARKAMSILGVCTVFMVNGRLGPGLLEAEYMPEPEICSM